MCKWGDADLKAYIGHTERDEAFDHRRLDLLAGFRPRLGQICCKCAYPCVCIAYCQFEFSKVLIAAIHRIKLYAQFFHNGNKLVRIACMMFLFERIQFVESFAHKFQPLGIIFNSLAAAFQFLGYVAQLDIALFNTFGQSACLRIDLADAVQLLCCHAQCINSRLLVTVQYPVAG